MNLSYWEHSTWLDRIDFAIVGSGIVGLSCALAIRRKYPGKKILVLEKGILPSGASTKNAGFACFGSLSEILEDLNSHSEDEVLQLVEDRIKGLELLREEIGDEALNYVQHGGYELFPISDKALHEACLFRMDEINSLLKPVVGARVFSEKNNSFGFQNIQNSLVYNAHEGQLNTGEMMRSLLKKVQEEDILLLNSMEVTSVVDKGGKVTLEVNGNHLITAAHVLVATNGFASQLLDESVMPARAQVLITEPLNTLPFQGTFHLDKGYYYFRNVGNRVLFGGGRNLDFKAEETANLGLTPLVQNTLEEVLHTTILPNTPFEIESRWSGIMGVGPQKKPIVRRVSERVSCGVRLGGMGVAIGSSIGRQLADLV